MYEWLFKFSMMISSFTPLWLGISVRYLFAGAKGVGFWFSVVVLTVLILSIVFITHYLLRLSRSNSAKIKRKLELENVRLLRNINIEYLFGFVLPLFVFDFDVTTDVIIFLIIFISFAVLYFKYNIIYINILLSFAGYRLYEADVVRGVAAKKVLFLYRKKFRDKIHFICDARFYGEDYAIVVQEKLVE